MAEENLTLHEALQRARDCYHAGNFADAIRLCQAILNAVPNLEDALSLLSVAAIGLQDWGLAEEVLRVAIQHYPGTYVHHLNLGFVLQKTGRDRQATTHYENVLEQTPSHLNAYKNLIALYRKLQVLEKSVNASRARLNAVPDDAEALENLGDFLMMQAEYLGRQTAGGKEKMREAAESYDRACEQDGNKGILCGKQATVLVHLGRYTEAADQANQAIQAGENSGWSHYALAYARAGQGDKEGFYQAYRDAFSRHVRKTTTIQ